MDIMSYVKPELLVLALALYFLGMAMKGAAFVQDKYIPFFLGLISIVLCAVWVIANTPVTTTSDILMAVFTSIVQGILVAALAVYSNQLIKQAQK